MQIRALQQDDLEAVLELFYRCFRRDHYYSQMFGKTELSREKLLGAFEDSIGFCVGLGFSVGVVDESGALAAFALMFDYRAAMEDHADEFHRVFSTQKERVLPYYDQLHGKIVRLTGDTLYLLSIAVAPEYQKQGMASSLVDHILAVRSGFHIVSDVSNKGSLAIYRQRGFSVEEIDEDYFYIEHLRDAPVGAVDFSGDIDLIVPQRVLLDRCGIAYQMKRDRWYAAGCRAQEDHGIPCFSEDPGALCAGTMVTLRYDALLEYQRLLNLCQYSERVRGGAVFYVQQERYHCAPLLNDTLEDMLASRRTEWSVIPDVYVSIPLQYLDRGKIRTQAAHGAAKALLHDMEFRTHYEAGIPSAADQVDDWAGLKKRIERYYLGTVRVQIFSEVTVDNYTQLGDTIGPAAPVDLYVSLDKDSSCAVLTWYSLSAPFLVSHLFDNIVRNSIMVVDGETGTNFFDYLKDRFGLIKRGTPKIFAVFPCDKDRLSVNQLASLLAGETIYPEGENFGEIIDEDILSRVDNRKGMGQYDRVFVSAYRNVVYQFSENTTGSVLERMYEESITLFYIELILFEEAAIQIADREIIELFTSETVEEPVQFLRKVDAIYDGYSQTIDFWDIRVNYPTSQKSIAMLREAFAIHELLDKMKRDQDQLQTVFGTKCDIIDRRESKRMDTSLAIISVFAVFSAWMDSYDYTATWDDVLPLGIIHLLQRIFFVLIMVTAGYAVTHLFGGRIGLMVRRRREKRRFMRKRRDDGR